MTETAAPKPSDLKVRALSAIVMVAVAGSALWLGGLPFTAFAIAIGIGIVWEWWGLARKIATSHVSRAIWLLFGVIYVGFAVNTLVNARSISFYGALFPILLVASIDVGAYFSGRAIGGPKIAPSISPSKTWAGLLGGVIAATLAFALDDLLASPDPNLPFPGPLQLDWAATLPLIIVLAVLVAVVAQAGDFFESWMKRRAGVKDSGKLIPGHGGLFDRADGLLAVLMAMTVVDWFTLQ